MTLADSSASGVRVRRSSLLRAALAATLFILASASNALAAGSISGKITDSVSLAGLAGAKVQFYDLNGDDDFPIATATADASGNYSQALPDGSYGVLTQNAQGYINQIWQSISCSAICDVDNVTPVVVSGGAVTNINFALVPNGGRIAGTVTSSATGTPLQGVTVSFFDGNGQIPFSTATTDQNGNYISDAGTVTGNVFVVTSNTLGYQDEAYNDHKCRITGACVGTPDHVAVTVGATTANINFALDLGGRITGTVKDINNVGLANVLVRIYDATGDGTDEVLTDGSGNFISSGLPSGTYYVGTTHSGLADYLWNGLLCANDFCNTLLGTPISVTVPATTSGINFVLPPGQSISGTVTNAVGDAPIADAFINLSNAVGTFVGGANTDAAGHFTTGAVPPGTYYVAAFANGYVTQLYDHLSCGTCPPTNGTPILVSNQPVTNINLQLLANGTGSVTGTVTDGFNNNLPTGLTMQLVSGSGQVVSSTTTNNGVYTFSNVATGSYYVRTNVASGNGAIPYINQLYSGVFCLNACSVLTNTTATRVNVSNGATTSNINFTLQRGGVITGTIIAVTPNTGLNFAAAQVYNSAGTIVGTFNTNANGVYTSTGLPPGNYYVRTTNTRTYIAQLWQNQSCPQSGCAVTSGTPIAVNGATVSGIDFALVTGGQISGNVKDATTGSNLQNVAVQIFSNTGVNLGSVNTDSSGNYTSSGLPVGTYFARTATSILNLPNNTSITIVDQLYNGTTCVPFCTNPTAGTPITVSTFAVTPGINFSLSRGSTISGAVTDASTGAPVQAGVQIYTSTGAFAKQAATNAAGGYSVSGLPPGNYFARTSVPGTVFYQDQLFNRQQCSDGCTVTNGTPITLLANVQSNGVDFALSSGAGGVSGTITDLKTSAPLAGVLVDIYNAVGVFTKFASTNAAGFFATSGLAPGNYYARTRQVIPTGHAEQLYSNKRCTGANCVVTDGTPIAVGPGALTTGIDFALVRGMAKADFDGDAKTDVGIWRPGDGNWYVRNSSNSTVTVQPFGAGYAPYNDIPVPGDYDGDGKTDFAIWRPMEGGWYVRNSSTNTVTFRAFGAGYAPYNDIPVPGDYDGDGKTDIAIWRPMDGNWYIRNSSNNTTTVQAWGAGYAPYNDIPVPGDYDGDGKTDIAIWRPMDGSWYIRNSSNNTVTFQKWGAGYAPYNDIPVPGDYDGDGKSDIAIWRPLDGSWYVRNSSNNTTTFQVWGAGYAPYNDIPVPSKGIR